MAKGTPVLMSDLSWKAIEDVVPGDVVYTLSGKGGLVTDTHAPKLTSCRRMITLAGGPGLWLRMSDDHDLWCLTALGQVWGTFNYNWWLWDAEYEGTLDVPAIPLVPTKGALVAACGVEEAEVSKGWYHAVPQYDLTVDPDETIYGLALDEGGGFVAGGFVVIADYCRPEHVAGVSWGAREQY